MVVKDFNGDGIPDLAVGFMGGVRLLLGNGDGTFQIIPISYVAGGYFNNLWTPCIALADGPGHDRIHERVRRVVGPRKLRTPNCEFRM